MKKNGTKKIISAIAVLALSATAVCGALSFSACGDKYVSDGKDSAITVENGKMKISTAKGTVYSESSGKAYYVSNSPAADADGTKEKPYDIAKLLGAAEQDSILRPGDTVYVLPGTYRTTAKIELHVSGSYKKYIRIINAAADEESGYTGEEKNVVLDFSEQSFDSTARGVQIYGNYIYWYGIDICGAGDNGMYIGGSYNTIEYSEFYNNRDTGLQLGRSYSDTTDPKYNHIDNWPNYNLVKNCTSHNNYDNQTYGENADGFAAKLTVGYGNVFDGCIAYRNSDDGWDLFAKTESGDIGTVIMYNCVAFENGYLEYTQQECNKKFPGWNGVHTEAGKKPDGSSYTKDEDEYYGLDSYKTRDGDGNGFKLGGSVMEGDVIMYNCLSFNNRMHGVTDNSNPGVISLEGITSYNNSAAVDNNPQSPTFGYIIDIGNDDSHGNIDVARQNYSYNNLDRVLAVGDEYAKSLSADAYRGSVVNSVLGKKIVTTAIDADTKTGVSGSNYTPPASGDVFEKLPFTKTVDGDNTNYTFNITGLNDLYAEGTEGALKSDRVHITYRNEDGSINMKEMLKIKAGYNPIEGVKVGAYLSESNWGAYEHYYDNDFVNGSAESEDKAKVERALEALNLNCDPDYVYQDFEVPDKMIECELSWESSNPDVAEVGEEIFGSISQTRYIKIIVYRPIDNPVTVTLTATATCGTATDSRNFTIVVQPGKPSIGKIYVKSADGNIINDGGNLIIDKYSIFTEPEVVVENGIDHNGKILDKSLYEISSTYIYQTDSTAEKVEIKGFTPSTAGVYTVTHNISIKGNAQETRSMTYKIYTASTAANVQFTAGASLVVNRDGYRISGTLSSATGYLYAVSSPTELDFTTTSIKDVEGVVAQEFRGETLNLQFENTNNAAYYIYYALSNLNGEITSQVYSQAIGVAEVDTAEKFIKVATGKPLTDENPATTVYLLTSDLDFTDVTSYPVGEAGGTFSGLFNGLGHTVSNITLTGGTKEGVALFNKVSNGTLMNFKFDNIVIDGNGQNNVGIVGNSDGGYFHNIAVTDIKITNAGQRAGGLLGRISVGNPVYIDHISIVNSEEYTLEATQRVGGIVGFAQSSKSGGVITYMEIYVSDCYVKTDINGGQQLGGIFGTYHADNNGTDTVYNLEILTCVYDGKITASGSTASRCGGMLGYQVGARAVMKISHCISLATFNYSGLDVTSAQKNLSGIVGGFIGTLDEGFTSEVIRCLALFEEYNTNFDVTASENITVASQFENRLNSDWTIIYEEGSTDTVKAPYVSLNYLGNWD